MTPAHRVTPCNIQPGGVLAGLAPDGLVEAVSIEGGKAFALAVQWHPEWQVSSNPIYLAMPAEGAPLNTTRMRQ